MEKSVRAVKVGKGKAPLHQGIMKLLVDFKKYRRGVTVSPSKGGFSRLSKMPGSKAQLLLGLSPLSPMPKSRDTILDFEEDSLSQDGDLLVVVSKDGDSSKEDHTVSDFGKFGERGNSLNMVDVDPIEKGPAKGLDRNQTLTKKLQFHLKVVKNMKDLSVAKEQQNPTGK
eukprot:Gb_00900 [translate_table: standard]